MNSNSMPSCMTTRLLSRCAMLGFALVASPVLWAHTLSGEVTHGHSLWAGFMHPFMGLDHLLVMVVVGVWSALVLRQQRIWLAPLAFVCMLVIGAVAALMGVQTVWVEPMIAASLLVLGLLLASRLALPLNLMLGVVGGFAVFHGMAHGIELAQGDAFATLAGMVAATALLHFAGLGLGHALLTRRRWQQVLGAGVAVVGSYSLLQWVV